jgi:hypothetical protein
MPPLERRKWVPDVKMIADQLVEDYRSGTWSVERLGPGVVHRGDDGAVGTLGSWFDVARFHGEELQEDPANSSLVRESPGPRV